MLNLSILIMVLQINAKMFLKIEKNHWHIHTLIDLLFFKFHAILFFYISLKTTKFGPL
jgi:hypothetical protein